MKDVWSEHRFPLPLSAFWSGEFAHKDWCSQAVTHPITNYRYFCLTLVIKRIAALLISGFLDFRANDCDRSGIIAGRIYEYVYVYVYMHIYIYIYICTNRNPTFEGRKSLSRSRNRGEEESGRMRGIL